MCGLTYTDLDYCKYGTSYRMRARLWDNVFKWKPQPLCKKDRGSIEGNRHTQTAQRGPRNR